MHDPIRLRPFVGWVAVLAVAVTAAVALAPTGDAAQPASPDALRRGGQLYARNCMMCHGSDGGGVTGTGTAAGPPLRGVQVAYVDQTLRTGRMPLLAPELGVIEDRLGDEDREALVAWMRRELGLRGRIPDVAPGDPGRGQALYSTHCAACHGSAGEGGIGPEDVLIRAVVDDDPVAVVEAIRVGPFRMPQFSESILSDEDAADIAAFVEHLSARPATPLGMTTAGQVTAALLVLALAPAALATVVLVARRRPGAREEGR